MSTKYQMWLNYNNDKKKLRIPMLPEKIKVTVKGKQTSVDIDKLGEVFYRGMRDARTISFSSFFPAAWDGACSVSERLFKDSKYCHKRIMTMMGNKVKKPVHFVLTGCPLNLNMYVLISSYTAEESGGDVGTISYSIELKEYRTASIRKITKGRNGKTKVSNSKKRVNNKTVDGGKYTIKEGDCLWNIAKKYYGKGEEYTRILEENRKILDEDARKHGYSSSNNGNILFAGLKITIPEK